ncbi:MAG: TIGR00730 family Rossman fold protein [Hydrococcus sp. Prado102]|nr:TIGR00730 family Rossman fold protein [Hydrococcus sp. Prado102]
MKRVCVFCGSSMGSRPAYKLAAQAMGEALARRGLGLVYGGGNVGLMGVVADAVLAAGGEAIGVIPDFLVAKEIAHSGLSKLHVVGSMHDRKALMAELSDGFIAMPGGYGTLEEFCEVLTWSQLGLHQKPHGLLNIEGYYDPFLRLFDHALAEQFLKQIHRSLVIEASDPNSLLDLLANYRPQDLDKWSDRVDLKP